MRVHYQAHIPLIGQSILDRNLVRSNSPLGHALAGSLTCNDFRNLLLRWEKQTRPAAVIKPGRYLGALWIDARVAQRRAVSLCEDCRRKYGSGVTKSDYVQRLGMTLADCDGCGGVMQLCKSYYSRLM